MNELRRCIVVCVLLALVLTGSNGAGGTGWPQTPQKGGDVSFDCVLGLAKATRDVTSQIDTLISLAEVYAQGGNRDKALQLMNRARQVAETEQPPPALPINLRDPDGRPSDLARGFLKIAAYDDAMELARKLKKAPVRASVLALIASEMAPAGDKQKANSLLVEALQTVSNPTEESWTLAEVASGYARLRDCGQARRIALSMSDKWPYIKAPSLAKIASECAKNGSKAIAMQLASQTVRVAGLMSVKILVEDKYEVLAQAASAYIDAGERQIALRLLAQALRGVRKAEINMRAVEAIADAYANAGLYEKAKEIAESINYKPSQADALLRIARRYISAKDKSSAAELIERSFKITLADKHDTPDLRFERFAAIAVEYVNAARPDRANEALVESLRELRREEDDLSELLLTVLMAYGKAKLTPDDAARNLIQKLCSGEAFELTPEEVVKQRRVEEAADRFIQRWHQTLDMNILFDELYVSNPKQRQLNARMFYGVYKFLSASVGPAVDRDVDETLMRDAFFAFWNLFYLSDEYQLAYQKPDPPEIEKQPMESRRTALDAKRMSRRQVEQYIDKTRTFLPLYRKYLPPEVFKTQRYTDNLKRQEESRSEDEKPFRIAPGFPEFGVPNDVEVYYLRKGVFEFYFIEENGKLKVLTLGFEL